MSTKKLIESEKSSNEIVESLIENRQFKDSDVGKGQVGIRCYEGSYQFSSEIISGSLKDAQKLAKKKLQDQKDSRATDETLWADFVVEGSRVSKEERVKIK